MARFILRGITIGLGLAYASMIALTFAWPAIHGWQAVTIETGSMQPQLAVGDLAFVEPIHQPQPGDVITYHDGAVLRTHRVTAEGSGLGTGPYWVKGDANATIDAFPVWPDQIVGRVVGSVPMLGTLHKVLTLLPVILAVIVLLLLDTVMEPTRASRAGATASEVGR